MGNLLSTNNSTVDSINWKDIKTSDMSSEIKFNRTSRPKVEQLVNTLNKNRNEYNNDIIFSDTLENIFNNKYLTNESANVNQLNHFMEQQNTKPTNNIEDSLSDTSPFISSEMYQYIVNSNGNKINNQVNKQQGGGKKDNDSSTSTSSSSKNIKGGRINRVEINSAESMPTSSSYTGNNNNSEISNLQTSSESNIDTVDNVDYVSSSAHTNGEYSQIQSNSANSTSQSVQGKYMSESLHTSDIKMVNL